jgi:hypothetical protein
VRLNLKGKAGRGPVKNRKESAMTTDENENTKNHPVFDQKIGLTSASVFKNISNGKTHYNTQIDHQYEKDGNYIDTKNYSLRDLLALREVVNGAIKFQALKPK